MWAASFLQLLDVKNILFLSKRNHKTIDSQRNGVGVPCLRQIHSICVSVPFKYFQQRIFHHLFRQNIPICHISTHGISPLVLSLLPAQIIQSFHAVTSSRHLLLLLLIVDDVQLVHSSPAVSVASWAQAPSRDLARALQGSACPSSSISTSDSTKWTLRPNCLTLVPHTKLGIYCCLRSLFNIPEAVYARV